MRTRLALIVALAVAGSAAASNQDPPVALSDTEVLQLVSRDSRMTVPVVIAGAGPWPFVVDTGAQRTVISRELANVLRLPRGRDVRLIAMTGASQVATAIIPSLRVSTIGGGEIEAPALAARHLGAPGLLGIDTLQDKKVSIDFAAQTMTVGPSSRRGRARLRPRADEVVVQARNLLGQLVVTDATFRGRRIQVVLDTGTAISVGNGAFHRLAGQHGTRPVAMTSVVGDQLQGAFKTVGDVAFGDVVIQNLPVAFADAAPFRQFRLEKRPALLLGMDALALFGQVDIDFPNRELRLRKPPATLLAPSRRANTVTAVP